VVGPVTPRLRERHSGPRHGTSSLAALTLVGCHPVDACVASTSSVMLGRVRHATQEGLDRLEVLLFELRKLPQLRERKRGYFSRGSRAFLHFHEDASDLYVDVRLDSKFQRLRVTSRDERADFLSQVREALQADS
jgi:hypothetical protein